MSALVLAVRSVSNASGPRSIAGGGVESAAVVCFDMLSPRLGQAWGLSLVVDIERPNRKGRSSPPPGWVTRSIGDGCNAEVRQPPGVVGMTQKDRPLHEHATALEGSGVYLRQQEPLTVAAAVFEPLMPVAFNAHGIVRLDRVHHFHLLGEL